MSVNLLHALGKWATIEPFHSRDQHLWKYIGTNKKQTEVINIRKYKTFNSYRSQRSGLRAVVSLFWDTNMVDVTSCENSVQVFGICFLACQYLFDGCQKAASFAKKAMVKARLCDVHSCSGALINKIFSIQLQNRFLCFNWLRIFSCVRCCPKWLFCLWKYKTWCFFGAKHIFHNLLPFLVTKWFQFVNGRVYRGTQKKIWKE